MKKALYLSLIIFMLCLSFVHAEYTTIRQYNLNETGGIYYNIGADVVPSTKCAGCTSVDAKLSKGLDIDATTERLNLNYSATSIIKPVYNITAYSNYTLSYWIKWTSWTSPSNTGAAYMRFSDIYGGNVGVEVYVNNQAGTCRRSLIYVRDSTTFHINGGATGVCDIDRCIGRWCHYVFYSINNGSDMNYKYYINNQINYSGKVAKASFVRGNSTYIAPAHTETSFIGNDGTAGRFGDYILDQVVLAQGIIPLSELWNNGDGTQEVLTTFNPTINFYSRIPLNDTNINSNTEYSFLLTEFEQNVNCSIKLNNVIYASFKNIGNGEHSFYYNVSDGLEGYNTLNLSCVYHSGDETDFTFSGSSKKYFYQDTYSPVINYISFEQNGILGELNDGIVIGELVYNISMSDANLYSVNVSINDSDSTDHRFYKNLLSFPDDEIRNSTGLTANKFYTLNVEVCDAHTQKYLDLKEPSKEVYYDSFKIYDISIDFKDELSKPVNLIYSSDRWIIEAEFKTYSSEKRILLESLHIPQKITGSEFIGHYVIGKTWIDFEDAIQRPKAVEIKNIAKNQYEIILTYEQPIKALNSRSIGLINCIDESVSFQMLKLPSFTPIYRNPLDLNLSNGWPNITEIYEYTDATTLFYDYYLNTSYFYINGVEYSKTWQSHIFTNTSENITAVLYDNEIYGGTHPITPSWFDIDSPIPYPVETLALDKSLMMTTLYNVSGYADYGFLEFMANNSEGSIVSLYACNSSYISGKIFESPSCVFLSFYNLSAPWEHCHSSINCHHIIPFNVLNGKINDLLITNPMYFIIGFSDEPFNVYRGYPNENVTRPKISNNAGQTWQLRSGIVNLHIHQFDIDDMLITRVSGYNTYPSVYGEYINKDKFELENALPQPVNVILPANTSYAFDDFLPFKFSESVGTFPIDYYNVFLYNESGLHYTIFNQTSTLTEFDIVYSRIGRYYAYIEAQDTLNNKATSFSQWFSIGATTTTTTTTTEATTTTTLNESAIAVTDLTGVIFTLFLGLIYLASLFFYFTLRGYNNRRISILNILHLFAGMALGLNIISDTLLLGFPIIAVSIVIFVFGSLED